MEQNQMPQPGPGLCGSDREIFERVWGRVTRSGGAESPIEPVPAAEWPHAPQYIQGYMPQVTAPEPAPVPAMPAPVQPEPSPAPEPRRAEGADIRCLGPSSAVHGAELQAFIEDELGDHRTYTALSRRTAGQASRTFASMAADEKRHAKRLSAAYFLISGVRYWPADRAPVRLEGTYLSTLRSRFLGEQKGEAEYRAAAGRTEDPCLRELYLELAEDENAHGWMLRGMLEKM